MIPCAAPIGEVPMWTIKNRPRYNRDKLRYPSDLTDAEWAYVEPLIPPAKRGGGKRRVDMRDVVVVERFLAWLGRNRRLAKDFEGTVASATAFLYAASVLLLTRRLARSS